jgi:hypothetical protein
MMRCSQCDSPLPEGAEFCVECGAPVRAATGRTVALDPGRPAAPAPPADLPAPPAPVSLPGAPVRGGGRRRRGSLFDGSWRPMAHGLGARSGAIFLIGLGVLFFTNTFWPGILALLGITGAIDELGNGNPRAAAIVLTFMGGLAVLFLTGSFWPGILVLLGLVTLLDRVG